jgi:uncharacterized protein
MNSAVVVPAARRRNVLMQLAGLCCFLLIAGLMLTWAKWAPYSHKLEHLWSSHTWPGKDVLAKAGAAGSAPSIAGAWAFTRAYFV